MIERKEFFAAFQLSKLVMFYVNYFRCGNNKEAYFATSADHFIRSKRDIDRGGQCQEDILPHDSSAYRFYKKWNRLHLHDLTDAEYAGIRADMEQLMNDYNYILKERPYKGVKTCCSADHLSFSECVELSMMQPKKIQKKKEAS